MNIKRFLALILIVTVLLSVSVNAAYVDKITVNNSSQLVNITGSIDTGSETELTVTVLNPGYDVASLSSLNDNNFSNIVNYFRQITTDSQGKYEISYKLIGSSGEYIVVLNHPLSQTDATNAASFEFYSISDINKAVAEVNSAASVSELKSVIESKYKYLDIDMSDYLYLSSDGKTSAVTSVLTEKNSLSDGFQNNEAVAKSVEAQSALFRINELNNNNDLLDVLTRNKASLGLDELDAWNSWENFTDESKLIVCSELLSVQKFESINALCTQFSQRVVLEAINSLTNWNGLKKIVTDNSATLYGINISAYLAITDTSSIDKAVISKAYKKIEDFVKEINYRVSTYKTPSDKPLSSNTSTPSSPAYVAPVTNSNTQPNDTQTQAFPFLDMDSTQWAKPAVQFLYNKGIINGKTNTEFYPDDFITREEFAKMLVETFANPDLSATVDFKDVDARYWYAAYIATAFKLNIVKGRDDGTFGVGIPITREDMCVMAYRAATMLGGYTGGGKALLFNDKDSISTYALESISSLYTDGVINGMGDGRFMPQSNATRAQAAQVLYQLVKNKE